MTRGTLEAQLEAATRDFIRNLLSILRDASLADVAGFIPSGGAGGASRARRTGAGEGPAASAAASGRERRKRGPNRSADLAPQIVSALESFAQPTAARALAERLGVPLDALAKPLKELRDEGRIVKQGDKRATKYALSA